MIIDVIKEVKDGVIYYTLKDDRNVKACGVTEESTMDKFVYLLSEIIDIKRFDKNKEYGTLYNYLKLTNCETLKNHLNIIEK